MPAHSASKDTLLRGHDGCLGFDLTEHSPKKSTSCDSLAVVMLLAHIHNALMEWLAPAPTTSRQRRARKTSDRVRAIGATRLANSHRSQTNQSTYQTKPSTYETGGARWDPEETNKIVPSRDAISSRHRASPQGPRASPLRSRRRSCRAPWPRPRL